MSILLTTLIRMIASRQLEILLGKTSHQWYVADSSTVEWISFCGIQKNFENFSYGEGYSIDAGRANRSVLTVLPLSGSYTT